ncbi:MAG: hypothetical protein QW416_05805 [Candidatus Nitrosocaldaceae archaeon]
MKAMMIASIALLITMASAYGAQQYGYQTIKPGGSYSKIIGVKGQIYPYTGSSTTDHVDRMIYLFSSKEPYLSVGLGHVEYSYGNIYYTRYFDEGLKQNIHWVYNGSPTNWYTAEVYTTSSTSKTYYWKINGQVIGSWDCTTCNPINIAGVTSWGNNANYVNGNFKDLQLKRNTDTNYQYFNSVANLRKCYEEPTTLGFEYPLQNNSINQLIVDATSVHECSGDVYNGWLYRAGNWG